MLNFATFKGDSFKERAYQSQNLRIQKLQQQSTVRPVLIFTKLSGVVSRRLVGITELMN